MYAQGTSSLEYPVKNLRVKFKGDKIAVRPGLEPVDLVTFNLGFLPGSDKKICTNSYTTTNAIKKAYELLNVNGIIILTT